MRTALLLRKNTHNYIGTEHQVGILECGGARLVGTHAPEANARNALCRNAPRCQHHHHVTSAATQIAQVAYYLVRRRRMVSTHCGFLVCASGRRRGRRTQSILLKSFWGGNSNVSRTPSFQRELACGQSVITLIYTHPMEVTMSVESGLTGQTNNAIGL